MDKNKSRIDLLAAGREKLQQFRQKKDNKGSSSRRNSSKKSTKSESRDRDVDTVNATSESPASSHVSTGDLSSHAGSSMSNPTENPAGGLDDLVGVSDLKESSIVGTKADHNAELVLKKVWFSAGIDLSPQNTEAAHTSMASSDIIIDSEGDNNYVGGAVSSDLSVHPASVDPERRVGLKVILEGRHSEEDLLPTQEYLLPTSLVQVREDQEADCHASKQLDGDGEIELEGDKQLPLCEHDSDAETLSGMASMEPSAEDTSSKVKQTGEIEKSSALVDTISSKGDPDSLRDFPANRNEEKLEMVLPSVGSSTSLKEEVIVHTEDRTAAERYSEQQIQEESVSNVDKAHDRPTETKMESLDRGGTVPSIADVTSINLLQLTEVIKGLNEGEFRFLLEARQPVSDAQCPTSSLFNRVSGFQDLLENLREELIITNLTKDIIQFQVAEQQMEVDHQRHKLVDEISHVNLSLNAAKERNQSLVEEISQCRSKLQAVSSAREELETQLLIVKAEGHELFSKGCELENSLVRSHGDLLRLSEDLDNCKDFIAVLQVENEILNGAIALEKEDKKTIEEEKESYERENEKILAELAGCKSFLAALEVVKANLMENLSSLTEERRKLEEEREPMFQGNKMLLSELGDSHNLVAALQVENANLNQSLALATEERIKLEEDRDYLFHGKERLSSELLVLHGRLSIEDGERIRSENDLKEAMIRLEQITNENIFLNNSLAIHKAKIEEHDDREVHISSQAEDDGNQAENSELVSAGGIVYDEKDSPQVTSMELLDSGSFDGHLGFVALKQRVDKSDMILKKLEKAIEKLYSHTASFGRQGSKVTAAGVSKLIQAFEPKVIPDENEAGESVLTEIESPTGQFEHSKELAANLRALLQQLGLDAERASILFLGEQDRGKIVNSSLRELRDQYEALENHSTDLLRANIEVGILCEALEVNVDAAGSKITELEVLNESLKRQDLSLKMSKSELANRLCGYESRITELLRPLYDVEQSSSEMASLMCYQLDNLQNGTLERIFKLEQEWNVSAAQIVETVGKLDESVGKFGTSTISIGTLDINSCVATSVSEAIMVIGDLKEKLAAACIDREESTTIYNELNEKYVYLHGRNELAIGILRNIYGVLYNLLISPCGSLSGSDTNIQSEKLSDPLDYCNFEILVKQLENYLGEREQLESLNRKLHSELINRTEEFEDLSRRHIDSDVIHKIIEDVQSVLNLEGRVSDTDGMTASQLESWVTLLLQKYKETEAQLTLSREEYRSNAMELTEVQERMHEASTSGFQNEKEITILKERISQLDEALVAAHSELKEKVNELEQSEQRVSSTRERLSIAVAKGKNLVVQRDGLKQSLAEKSSELERCLKEVQLKDTMLHEVETKLKTYSEAGERVEALESELSYIRNSATAIRESFLLKDSLLQRIEEILEDLDLPEHFHSGDIIEKVDWLAKAATSNCLPPTDWNQKSSTAGVSYSDTGLLATDAWKDDVQPDTHSRDELRRKHEELQNKCCMLAEQNEMLEQSLMERNHLVQRWEELLDRIDIPSNLRSMEPEDRIEWLGSSLSEVHHERNSFKERIDYLENYWGSLSADLDESQRKVSDLEVDRDELNHEREQLSERLQILSNGNEVLSVKAVQDELEKEILQDEVFKLRDSLVGIEHEIRRLEDLIAKVLQDPVVKDLVSAKSGIDCFEGLLLKLIKNYTNLSSSKPVPEKPSSGTSTEYSVAVLDEARSLDTLDANLDINALKKDLVDTMLELTRVREERNKYMEMQQSLVLELQSLDKKREELQELLNQEELKSAALKEKLNVAVRKGKSLVQHRDGLKQTVEEMTTELERLKSGINLRENALVNYEQKCRNLSARAESVESLESENLLMRNQLAEMEHYLQENGRTLSSIVGALDVINVGGEVNSSDPMEKLVQIEKLCSDLRSAVISSEQESNKSKRAAELLLAELNEIQERNDGFQEELEKASSKLAELTKERDIAQAYKLEALAHLEKLSTTFSEERKIHMSQFAGLKSVIDQLRKAFQDINHLLTDAFSKDLELLHNLEANIESYLKPNDPSDGGGIFSFTGGFKSRSSVDKAKFQSPNSFSNSSIDGHFDENIAYEVYSFVGQNLKELMTEVDDLKEMLHERSTTFQEQAMRLSKSMVIVQKEMSTQKESVEALKRDVLRIESTENEKEAVLDVLRRNVSLLFEVCTTVVMELGQRKAELAGKNLTERDLQMNVRSYLSSEESVQSMADKTLLAVREFLDLRAEVLDGVQREMKITIANLQKELQEKDIQRERVCVELVGQIKEAEAATAKYSVELKSSKVRVNDLEKVVEEIEGERNLLQKRVRELQDGVATSMELKERVSSLNGVLAAKDQEIEALMQALDEEEAQMEDLTKKNEELDKVLKQKNAELEAMEASRGKIMKKLSVTLTKFDELHHLSGSLLTEVEKLQSQLLDRDSEISFLRQEVTRCTNDALSALQSSNTRNSEMLELLAWSDTVIAQIGLHAILHDEAESQVQNYKEILQKKISSILTEVDGLRAVAQRNVDMLQVERNKVEELTQRKETLEKSLREKESQLNLLDGAGDFEGPFSRVPEISEVEPLINKRAVAGSSVTPQVRSMRKGNNDQVALSIDMDPDNSSNSRLEDEDDDKVHGFKSLTTSRIVPKLTRPVSDMVDGLWVSCDRALMRQPALRLGIILYWAILHALVAAFVV